MFESVLFECMFEALMLYNSSSFFMKKFFVATIFSAIAFCSFAQTFSQQDKIALEIPQSATNTTTGISQYIKSKFSSDSDRVRALFVWVANNINYDVDKVRFKKLQERTTVNDVLKTRLAVCQGYSELLSQLIKECGFNSVVIAGYTKQQDGSFAILAHAWVAAEIDKSWYLFDPTWAAGTVNDFVFTRRFSLQYYKLTPQQMIADHMPFDQLYQFSNYPLQYDDFNNGKIVFNTSKPYFNYVDTLNAYNKLDTLNQFKAVARRIVKAGDKNQLVHDYLKVLTKNQNMGDSRIGYDGAVVEFKKAMEIFNNYIAVKNKRFATIADGKEIEKMIEDVLLHFNNAKQLIEPVTGANDEQKRIISNFNNSLYGFYRRVDEEKIFVKNYLQKKGSPRP